MGKHIREARKSRKLSLAGTKKWWPRKILERFALAHLFLPIRTIADIFSRVVEAITETQAMIPAYIQDHPEFQEIGVSMLAEWAEGVREFGEKEK